MPIKPELQGFYPIDWEQLSKEIRFKRARGRCEHCGRPHGQVISHLGDGRWFDAEQGAWRDGQGRGIDWLDYRDYRGALKRTKVILATAHLNHDPSDNRLRNLKALCQRCHLDHDRSEHRKQTRITILERRASGDLFTGPYKRW